MREENEGVRLVSCLRVVGPCHDKNYWDGNAERVVLPASSRRHGKLGTNRPVAVVVSPTGSTVSCKVAKETNAVPFTRTTTQPRSLGEGISEPYSVWCSAGSYSNKAIEQMGALIDQLVCWWKASSNPPFSSLLQQL